MVIRQKSEIWRGFFVVVMVLLIKTSQQKVFLSFSNSKSIFRITGYQTDYVISRKAHVKKTIAVACDHAGFELKECVIDTIKKTGCDVIDVGTYSKESADFPDYVKFLWLAQSRQPARRRCAPLRCRNFDSSRLP